MARRILSVIKTETTYQINRFSPDSYRDRTIKITFLTSSTIQENRLQNHGGSIKPHLKVGSYFIYCFIIQAELLVLHHTDAGGCASRPHIGV
jgi:hypothetical protein